MHGLHSPPGSSDAATRCENRAGIASLRQGGLSSSMKFSLGTKGRDVVEGRLRSREHEDEIEGFFYTKARYTSL